MKNKNVTAEDVALATGLTKRQVDGIFTAAIQKKGFGNRVPAQVKTDDDKYVNVKYLTLSDVGCMIDLDAE